MLPLAGPDCTVAVEAVAVTGAFSVISISSGPAAVAPLFLRAARVGVVVDEVTASIGHHPHAPPPKQPQHGQWVEMLVDVEDEGKQPGSSVTFLQLLLRRHGGESPGIS